MARSNPAIQTARKKSLRKLCERLGYEFKDVTLLDRALTHASMGNEGKRSYERLEFLGDAFVNFAVADALFRRDTEFAEGQLTETRARIVSRQPLAAAARKLELHVHLESGKGLRDTERCSARILCDLVEAVIGAIYIDRGYDFAKSFILRIWRKNMIVDEQITYCLMKHMFCFSDKNMFFDETNDVLPSGACPSQPSR